MIITFSTYTSNISSPSTFQSRMFSEPLEISAGSCLPPDRVNLSEISYIEKKKKATAETSRHLRIPGLKKEFFLFPRAPVAFSKLFNFPRAVRGVGVHSSGRDILEARLWSARASMLNKIIQGCRVLLYLTCAHIGSVRCATYRIENSPSLYLTDLTYNV